MTKKIVAVATPEATATWHLTDLSYSIAVKNQYAFIVFIRKG